MASDASTYRRNAVPTADTGTPASVTRISDLVSEKISNPPGLGMFGDGTTATVPIRTASPAPGVTKCWAPRGGIEYSRLEIGCPAGSAKRKLPDVALFPGLISMI